MSFQPGKKSAVVYLRVSTARQGHSGLGLEAQRAAVLAHAASGGQSIVAEFIEIESGKRDDRPQLAAALAACRLHRATLVIAKLDRLARNVRFIAGIMDSGVDFVAVDMPHANRLTLHVMAAMAEHEAAVISERTKAALAAAKARGVKLGNPNGAAHLLAHRARALKLSTATRRTNAQARAESLGPTIEELQSFGVKGVACLTRALNERGIPSYSSNTWHPEQVRRILRRLDRS